MFPIRYNDYAHKIKKQNDGQFIFCTIRKKWVVLTPEEWVRQNFIYYLVEEKNIPWSKISVEKQIITHENKSRFDIVVYNDEFKPYFVIECKQQNIALDNKVLQQILNYQSIIQSNYLIATNGDYVIVWDCFANKSVEEIPIYKKN